MPWVPWKAQADKIIVEIVEVIRFFSLQERDIYTSIVESFFDAVCHLLRVSCFRPIDNHCLLYHGLWSVLLDIYGVLEVEHTGLIHEVLDDTLSELENMREKALKAYEAVFSDQETLLIDGVEYHMERTPGAKLRFFNIEGYSFLEQNPRKSSHWAKLAREGSLIMWVMKGRRYLGQVRDGAFHDLRRK